MGELQLKGLMGSGAEEEAEENIQPKTKKKPVQQRTYSQQDNMTPNIPNSEAKVESSPSLEGTVSVTDFTVAAGLQDLDDKINSMMEVSENKNDRRGQRGVKRICKVCGKEGQMADIQRHIEANHITGVSHTCNICGTTTRSRNAMAKHKSRNHTANL